MPPFRGADLHCHSTFSDGIDAPARLVGYALEAGLSVLALSDHDALHGLPEFEAAAKGTGLVPVAASELSTTLQRRRRPRPRPLPRPRRALSRRSSSSSGGTETRAARRWWRKLAALGMPLDIAAIREVVGVGAFGRPHIARAMVARGYVSGFNEAFDRWLAHGKPGYVPKPKWTLEEADRGDPHGRRPLRHRPPHLVQGPRAGRRGRRCRGAGRARGLPRRPGRQERTSSAGSPSATGS